MITISKTENNRHDQSDTYTMLELKGLSTDTKPTKMGVFNIDNGSTFIEIDTGKIYLYDLENEEWKEI